MSFMIEDTQSDYTIQLLANRFELLCDWKLENYQSPKIEYLLGNNKIALIYNVKGDELLDFLFGKTNEQDIKTNQHLINVATILKGLFLENDEYQKIMKNFIKCTEELGDDVGCEG